MGCWSTAGLLPMFCVSSSGFLVLTFTQAMLRKVNFLREQHETIHSDQDSNHPTPAPFAPLPYNKLKKEYKELKKCKKNDAGLKKEATFSFSSLHFTRWSEDMNFIFEW